MLKSSILIVMLFLASSCGGGMHTSGSQDIDQSYSTPWGTVTITKNAFVLGSSYPAAIIIPSIEGMNNTAFVVSAQAPCGVLAIDLVTDPLALSPVFQGLICPEGAGMFPISLHLESTDRAFLMTESHIIDFNPTTGEINTTLNLLGQLDLDTPLPISAEFDGDGDGAIESEISTINMSDPGDLYTADGKLYITMANFINYYIPAVAAPGLVRIFEIKESAPFLAESGPPIITTDFNPVGITPLANDTLAITNSGMSNLSLEGTTEPTTNSSIDIIDPSIDQIVDNISMGMAYLSNKKLAVVSDGTKAYVGSRTFGEVYAIDLIQREAINTHDNPITITGNSESSDYISSLTLSHDDKYLFVASFNNSAIYPVDVSEETPVVNPEAFPQPFVLGFPMGVTEENPTGINTGVGEVVVRPGIAGLDFTGADIFALTGTPGTVVTIQTYGADSSGGGN